MSQNPFPNTPNTPPVAATPTPVVSPAVPKNGDPKSTVPQKAGEIGGPPGPEPTRFGDWEIGGRCSDF